MNIKFVFAFCIVFGQVLARVYDFDMHAFFNYGVYAANEDVHSAHDMPLEPKSAAISEQLWSYLCSFFGLEQDESRGIPPVLFSDSDTGLEKGRDKFGKEREDINTDLEGTFYF